MVKRPEVSSGIAYLWWMLGFFGICGIHRFYLGNPVSGLIWLFTFGLFGFGQFIDLFLIPGMAQQRNRYLWERIRTNNSLIQTEINRQMLETTLPPAASKPKLEKPKNTDPMHKLLKAAAANNGVLSIGQAMLATDFPLEKVEELLTTAMHQGLVEIDNDPVTGRVRYHFDI